MNKDALINLVLPVVALLLIGIGVSKVYRPGWGMIVVGGLMWADLVIEGIRSARKPPRRSSG